MRIRNISGRDLTVPALGRLVLAGQIVDVDDVDSYTCQDKTWQLVADEHDHEREGDE